MVLPWDTGRNHQTEGFREGPRGGKSEQSPQGATFFPRVQCQFPWKPGKNPGCEETHWAGSAFGGGEKQEFSPLLFSHKLLDTVPPFALQPQFPFLCIGETSLSVYGVLKQYPGLIWALEPGVPKEPYLALRSSVPQTTIWDLSPGLALVSI